MVTFRKASKKRGAIRSNTAEEEEDDNENDSALDTIQLTQKKQRLVQGTLYKRGLDASKTLKLEPETLVEEKATVNEAENLLFKTTFSSTENGPTETIMQQKHMSAMEEFINRKLRKDKMNEVENSNGIENHIDDDAHFVREADMGAGGTMLGGTGIAEVILPVETRIETAKKTEELRARLPGAYGTKAASSAGYSLEQSDVSGLGSSFTQNFREFKQQRGASTAPSAYSDSSEHLPSTAPDHDRLGFQAARHTQSKQPRQQHQRGNDDRLLKQFIKKERAKR
jgi:hypothetical protein